MKVRAHHLAATLFAGAIFLSSLAWFSVVTPSAIATCSGGANIVISDPSAGATLSGTHTLIASSPASPAPTGVTFVLSAPTTQVLGEGTPATTSPAGTSYSTWNFAWNTPSTPNGNYSLNAIAHYSGGAAYDCTSSPVAVTVQNTNTAAPGRLDIAISPNTWQGAPGQKGNFAVSGTYTAASGAHSSVDAASGATTAWDTTTGTVTSSGPNASTLMLGTTSGDYVLGATVTMNGTTSRATAAIRVVVPSAGSAGPSPTPLRSPTASKTPEPVKSASPQPSASPAAHSPSSSTADMVHLETASTVFRPVTPTNSQPVVALENLKCLEQKLGTRYTVISSGSDMAKPEDRLKAVQCFSGSERIPATLAPVEPTHIAQVPVTQSVVTIDKAKNETISNKRGDKVAAILLGGTAAPNSDVFVYIFSDPMVLRAKTDNTGKWSYVLQNPLKPGHHEIYAVTAKDSGNFVRTSAIPVSIAAAAPGNQDGSLIIESQWQPAQVAYVAAAIVMVIVAIGMLLRFRRHSAPVMAGVGAVAGARPATATVLPTAPVTMYAAPKAESANAAPVVPAPQAQAAVVMPVVVLPTPAAQTATAEAVPAAEPTPNEAAAPKMVMPSTDVAPATPSSSPAAAPQITLPSAPAQPTVPTEPKQ